MNESKGMNNPHLKIVKCGGTKAQDKKISLITTKTTMGIIFKLQNSQLLTLSLPIEEIF